MDQGLLHRFWTLTEPWRYDAINEARDVTVRQFGADAGVRRGAILNAVAQQISGDPTARVDDIAKLLADCPAKPELRVFLKWVCEIYGYNQAVGLGTIPNLPAYNAFSAVCLGTQLATSPPLIPTTTFPPDLGDGRPAPAASPQAHRPKRPVGGPGRQRRSVPRRSHELAE